MSSWIEETNKKLQDFRDSLRDETPITKGGITEPKVSWAKGGHVKGTDDDFYETDVEYAFEDKVKEVVDGISRMLFEKNRKYGDSALNPARIFSKADSMEQLRTRIDDKLNRIKNAQDDEDEDVVQDLIGYLILLTIVRERNA